MFNATPCRSIFARCKTTQQYKSNIISGTFLTLSLFLLSACGGGGGSSTPPPADEPAPVVETYNLTATISGLNGTLVLQNNNSGDLAITTNGTFNFSAQLVAGSTYNVTINSSPANQSCSVTSGASGTITAVPVPAIVVQCTTIVAADTVAPVITLAGTTPVSLEVNGSYNDAGASASDDVDGNLTGSIVVGGDSVDTDTVGTYIISYSVSDGAGNAASPVTRTVNVVDTTAPVITLLGGTPVTVEALSAYSDTGAGASDNYDGDISGAITVGGDTVTANVVGSYTITYDVSDAEGNPAVQVTRTVNVEDTTAPVITLLGLPTVNLNLNDSYSDAGASARDTLDGNITNITVGGDTVDTSMDGTYTITYNVLDNSGNAAATVTRTVIVAPGSPAVSAYYSSAPNWNDYVKNDNTSQFDATNTLADGTETGGYSAVIHGGEMRAVNMGITTCTDQAATDALGVFDWVCDDSSDSALMVSTGLKSIDAVTGVTDSAATGQLIDSTASFVTDGIEVGDRVINTANSTFTTVTSVDGENQLTLAADIFALGASYSINRDKNLSDLLNFTSPGWLNNSVTVTGTGTGLPFTTDPAVWWSNPVTVDNDGIIAGDAVSGDIYLVTTNLAAAEYKIDASKVALVIQPGVTMSTSLWYTSLILVPDSQNFLWIEGAIDAKDTVNRGIYLTAVQFSVIRNVETSNATNVSYNFAGIQLDNSSNNRLSNITAANNTYGVGLSNSSNNNTLSNITAANNTGGVVLKSSSNNNRLSNITAAINTAGVYVEDSSNNTLLNIAAVNNGTGVYLGGSSYLNGSFYNTLSDIKAVNNTTGVKLIYSSNNTLSNISATNNDAGVAISNDSSSNALSNIIATNNGSYGVDIRYTSYNNTLSNVTAANNSAGVSTESSSTLMNVIAANNRDYGFAIGSNSTLSNITAANNGIGVYLYYSSDNNFTGLLKVGNNSVNDCKVWAGTDPGLVNSSCANNGASDATLTTGVTLASSFVAKVTTDDTANTNDVSGTSSYPADPAIFDWTSFENAYRGWGIDGSDFPNSDHQSRWTTGAGRIWDWSLANGDIGDESEVVNPGDVGKPVLQNVLTLPANGNAANTIDHGWAGTAADQAACSALVPGSVFNIVDDCRSTYLRNASEIVGDNIGNDNGLCESNETCLFAPNIGSYQGHGALITAGTFTDGDTLTGITLMKYTTNGY